MKTNNSGANHAVLHSQINRRSLWPIETSISDANNVLQAQNDRWDLGPMETSNSGTNHAV